MYLHWRGILINAFLYREEIIALTGFLLVLLIQYITRDLASCLILQQTDLVVMRLLTSCNHFLEESPINITASILQPSISVQMVLLNSEKTINMDTSLLSQWDGKYQKKISWRIQFFQT